ncbi:hypothetical protein GCM10023189_37890 [Nibrella saemangeumensis]|uniref:Putative exodeoxyribonuclease 8 PDDEXK-like domain-containing protein n=1 Tax=Nibrella saemangeumensis TaxID=1084526 RepID=A0ABP8NA83_9BACT
MDYRSIPRISNSDLTEFKNVVFGYQAPKPVAAFAFGRALHELILEPHQLHDLPADVDFSLLQMLATTARKDRFLSWALRFSRKESVQIWEDPATGLPLKSKLDVVHKNRLIVDIKSTSCKSFADFQKSCERYDYDRQAAFYLDSIGAKKFVFVAVQKVMPHNVWVIEHHTQGQFAENGRKKYRALLREWKRRAELGSSFIPLAWTVEPEPVLSSPCLVSDNSATFALQVY